MLQQLIFFRAVDEMLPKINAFKQYDVSRLELLYLVQ